MTPFIKYIETSKIAFEVICLDASIEPGQRGCKDSLGVPLEPSWEPYLEEVTEYEIESCYIKIVGMWIPVWGKNRKRFCDPVLKDRWDDILDEWTEKLTEENGK